MSKDRQQPRLERDRLGEPLYVGQRLVEISREYPTALRGWPTPSAWMRAVAHELNLRADVLDSEQPLFVP